MDNTSGVMLILIQTFDLINVDKESSCENNNCNHGHIDSITTTTLMYNHISKFDGVIIHR